MSTSRLVLVMLVLNIVTVTGGVGAAYWLLKSDQGGSASEGLAAKPADLVEYEYYPVSKIIVGVRGEAREHYFVLDLVLQAKATGDKIPFAHAEPLVRNSVVSYLSGLSFEELRALQIPEIQSRLESNLLTDFSSRSAAVPFEHVLISKLIVQ